MEHPYPTERDVETAKFRQKYIDDLLAENAKLKEENAKLRLLIKGNEQICKERNYEMELHKLAAKAAGTGLERDLKAYIKRAEEIRNIPKEEKIVGKKMARIDIQECQSTFIRRFFSDGTIHEVPYEYADGLARVPIDPNEDVFVNNDKKKK